MPATHATVVKGQECWLDVIGIYQRSSWPRRRRLLVGCSSVDALSVLPAFPAF
jgi:hypothetical protein